MLPYLNESFGDMMEVAEVATDTSAVLTCQPPSGLPEPTISWMKDDTHLQQVQGKVWTEDGGRTLKINRATKNDTGIYKCVASNTVDTRIHETGIKVVIKDPPRFIKLPPKTEQIQAGTSKHTINIEIMENPSDPPRVTWEMPDLSHPDQTIRAYYDPEYHSLVLLSVKTFYEGKYTVSVSNSVGTTRAETFVKVTPNVESNIIAAPVSQTWINGFTGSLQCRFTEGITMWTLPSGEQIFEGTVGAGGKYFVDNQGTLFVYDVNSGDSGRYQCENGVNSNQQVYAAEVKVHTQMPMFAPVIQLGSSDQTIIEGGTAVLLCEGAAQSKVTISWKKDGQAFNTNKSSRYQFDPSGTLTIRNILGSDGGRYTCIASSESGHTERSYMLLVNNDGIKQSWSVDHLPGPPGRPYASYVNSSCVLLHWEPPVLDPDDVIHYRIESYIYGLRSWETARGHIRKTSAWICDLLPGRPYLFVARAMNTFGYGHASHQSTNVTTLDKLPDASLPDGDAYLRHLPQRRLDTCNIVQLEPRPLSPTSALISWSVLNYPVFAAGFYIHFNSITHYSASQKPHRQIIDSPFNRSHTLTGLMPFATYNITVQVFGEAGLMGKMSAFKILNTESAPPTAPPQSVTYSHDNNRGVITVAWSPPPRKDWNCADVDLRFNVRVTSFLPRIQRDVTIADMNVTGGVYSVQLNASHTNYTNDVTVAIAAVNRAGVGVYSDPLRISPGDLGFRKDDPKAKAEDYIWVYVLLAGVFILILAVLAAVFYRCCTHQTKGGSRRLRPSGLSNEKTYNGSMGSNGIGGAENHLLEDYPSPQKPPYGNMTPSHHDFVTSPAYYQHSDFIASPHHDGASIAPSQLSTNGSAGAFLTNHRPEFRQQQQPAAGRTPDLIRMPSPSHLGHIAAGDNPEYAEIPAHPGAYELSGNAPSSVTSTENCAECQREQLLQQQHMMMTHLPRGSYGGLVQSNQRPLTPVSQAHLAPIASHSGGGGHNLRGATPTNQQPPPQFVESCLSSSQETPPAQAHMYKYHQSANPLMAAAADGPYTKLDESVSGSDPEVNNPSPPSTLPGYPTSISRDLPPSRGPPRLAPTSRPKMGLNSGRSANSLPQPTLLAPSATTEA
uniref:Robo6 protein n=1 Tax=Isodiametra pulchra TaxID=504439 RepID=A0A2P1DV92_ISOPU|nr:Robo6 protein [Isodiametra pulchra]